MRLPSMLSVVPSSALNLPFLRKPRQLSKLIKLAALPEFAIAPEVVRREEAVIGSCAEADGAWLAGPAPGALRFLEGAGAEMTVSISGLTEKLDIPGRVSLDAFEGTALVLAIGIVLMVFDDRRVFEPDDLSISFACMEAGNAAARAFLLAVYSKSMSGSRSSA